MQKLKTPLLIINFKAYATATGKNAVTLAKICEQASKETDITIAIAVQPADIHQITKEVKIPILAQHVDSEYNGPHTGSITAESVQNAGAIGSLVNHSEKPLDMTNIKKTILRLHELGMSAIACAGTSEMAYEIAKLNPDFIAIEPPELIGGDISVSEAKPEIITATTQRVKRMPVLCGAGIKTANDAAKAIKLGARGLLVASGITCAKNPEKAIKELIDGMKEHA